MPADMLPESTGTSLAQSLILAAEVAAQRVIACDINQAGQAQDWANAAECLTGALDHLLDARETERRI